MHKRGRKHALEKAANLASETRSGAGQTNVQARYNDIPSVAENVAGSAARLATVQIHMCRLQALLAPRGDLNHFLVRNAHVAGVQTA